MSLRIFGLQHISDFFKRYRNSIIVLDLIHLRLLTLLKK